MNGLLLAAGWQTYVLWGVIIVAIVGLFAWSSYSNKKRNANTVKLIEAVKPGNKVKTIGGICGVVVSVDASENTFVLETGDDDNKSYIKFDRKAIYQTDAVITAATAAPEAPAAAENTDDNAPAEPFEAMNSTDETADEANSDATADAEEAKDEKAE